MKQITEDYVSFEIAVLLKEKGFSENTICRYASVGGITEKWYDDYRERVLRFDWEEGYLIEPLKEPKDQYEIIGDTISAPTHQMALKWLRELGIVITIKTHYPSNPELCKIPYSFLIEDYRPSRNMEKEHGKYSTGYSSCANIDDFLTENKLLFDGFNFGEFEKYEQAVEAALKYTLENLI